MQTVVAVQKNPAKSQGGRRTVNRAALIALIVSVRAYRERIARESTTVHTRTDNSLRKEMRWQK